MTLEESIDKAIQAYFDGEDLSPEMGKIKPSKYSKKYFDEVEERTLGESTKKVK